MDRTSILILSVVLLLFYGSFTYPMYCLGRKFGVGTYLAYWLPVYNLMLLCRCAGIPSSNVIWILIPLTGPGYWAYVWGRIARRLGHSFWVYALTSYFVVPVLILAFDDSQPHLSSASVWRSSYQDTRWAGSQATKPGPKSGSKRLGLYCISGEFSGNEVEIPSEGIIIGRRPEQSNLVVSSQSVSAAHTKVWPDAGGLGLMVEDLNSTNGTFYSESAWGSTRPDWVEIRNPKLLKPGAHFRLGEDVAEFEVVEHSVLPGRLREHQVSLSSPGRR